MTDDLPKLQALIKATPQGGVVKLPPANVLNISSELITNRSIDLNGSSIALFPGVSWPHYQTIHVTPTLSGSAMFTGALMGGQTVLPIARPDIAVGRELILWLGDSPWGDVGTYENGKAPHCYMRCRCVANDGKTLTIDMPIEYDISGTTHYFYTPTGLSDDMSIFNGRILNSNPNGYGIFVEFSRNYDFSDLELDHGIGLGFCENGGGRDIKVNCIQRADKMRDGWFSKNERWDNILWRNAKVGVGDNMFASAEHNSDVRFGSVEIDADEDFLLTSIENPGSSVEIESLTVRGSGRMAAFGDYSIRDFRLFAPDVAGVDFSRVERFQFNGATTGEPAAWAGTLLIVDGVVTQTMGLPSGLYRSMRVRANAAFTGALYFRTGTEPDLSKDLTQIPLVVGQWVNVPCVSCTGSGNGTGDVNAIYHSDKSLTGFLVGDGSVDFEIEYWA